MQRDGICHEVIAPAPDLDPEPGRRRPSSSRCGSPASSDVTGVLAVELFETTDGRILVNELAMRPHNTGHWTQDGAVTSQFENHLRAVLDLPLGSPAPRAHLDGDGQHPRRRRRTPGGSTTGTRTRWPATRGCGCTSTARTCGRAARSATSTPTVRTWTDCLERARHAAAWFAATWATRASETEVDDVAGRHRDGLGLRLAGDGGRGAGADEFGIPFEADVVSAHRMPEEMLAYGPDAAGRGLRVIIAGAGGAAHLPGMLASVTPLPVIGVPVPLKQLDGLDSLLSIVQMPAGVPWRPSPSAAPATRACSRSASSPPATRGCASR